LHFVRPQKGVWGMNAGGLLDFFGGQPQNLTFRINFANI